MDTTTVDPCTVCGNTEVKLIDGYYYCVECGTQDENVREIVVEDGGIGQLADGQFIVRRKKKIRTVLKEKKEMSPEWYKWHAYNFILEGLSNDLIAAGAKESVKLKVLWIWTMYVKEFQNKEELGLPQINGTLDSSDKCKTIKGSLNIGIMKKSLLFSILYTALNLDGSDIQLSDLSRYIAEDRLSISNCEKFLPKEIKVELIPNWLKFHRSVGCWRDTIRGVMPLFRCCSLRPRVPDIRLLVDRYIKELCLPNDFKTLVFSLMQLAPHNLELDENCQMHSAKLPEYELVVMSYIVVAFKMCFGLDDDYDVRLSEAVEKVNEENCYLKYFKYGNSGDSERLFSFREWCYFIQLRKMILSKYYIPFAEAFFLDVDDYVFMEQNYINNVPPKKIKISDEIVMKLLEKIPQINTKEVIPKSEFKPTTTPFTTYTELVLDYLNEPDLRLQLSEDFTKYSLKYATENLHLLDRDENVVVGVKETKKEIKSEITGIFKGYPVNHEIVYVRNCDNKNWVKTSQPKTEHIKKIDASSSSDKESDRGYDSNTEIVTNESEVGENTKLNLTVKVNEELDKKSHILKEEDDYVNIFDDDFQDLKELDIKEEVDEEVNNTEMPVIPESICENINDDLESQSFDTDFDTLFDPQKFDRQKTIRELVLAACKKYKARIPDEYKPKEPRKRKPISDEARERSKAKRRKRNEAPNKNKIKPVSAKDEINNLVEAYFDNMQKDVLHELSTHVKSVINNMNRTNLIVENDTALMQNNTVDGSHRNIEQNESNKNNDRVLNQSASVQCLDDTDVRDDEGASVQCVDDADVDQDDEEVVNPKFDEKHYDIKQLYVEVDRESGSDDAFDVLDDPDVAEIIDKKIQEIVKSGSVTFPPRKPRDRRKPPPEWDSDDDIPLSVIRQEKLSIFKEKDKKILEDTIFPPLVRSKIKDFKYWIRHYPSSWRKSLGKNTGKFHKELLKNYPKSYSFVLKECGLIIQCSLYKLNALVMCLEERIMI